jgi:hypothetical protein
MLGGLGQTRGSSTAPDMCGEECERRRCDAVDSAGLP